MMYWVSEAEREEIERRARDQMRQSEQERTGVVLEIARLNDRRDHIQARLRSFLLSEMEMLARFEESDPVGFLKILPAGTPAKDPAQTTSLTEGTRGPEEPSSDEPADANGDGATKNGDGSTRGLDQGGRTEPGPPEGSKQGTGYVVSEVVRPRPAEAGEEGSRAEDSSSDEAEAAEGGESGVESDVADQETDKIRRILKDLD